MPPLSGWVYVIVGFMVAILSYTYNSASGTNKLILFFIVGIAFVIIGLIQIFRKENIKEKIARQKQALQPKQQPYPQYAKSQQIMQQRHPARLQYTRCMYCGTPVYTTQDYCHFCHAKLK